MECFVQASTLSHGVLGVLVDRAHIVNELGIVSVAGALSTGFDGVDRAVRPMTAALYAS